MHIPDNINMRYSCILSSWQFCTFVDITLPLIVYITSLQTLGDEQAPSSAYLVRLRHSCVQPDSRLLDSVPGFTTSL